MSLDVRVAQGDSAITKGLKEALQIGIQNAVRLTALQDGFWKNTAIKLPFPPDAIQVKEMAAKVGLTGQIEQFEMTLNRAAEEAVKQALPIFQQAIVSMSIGDGLSILRGGNGAATQFLKRQTKQALVKAFLPQAKAAIEKVQLTKYWNPLINKYNSISFFSKPKINPDLDMYVTEKAIDGLFYMVEQEENKIRKDPQAQVTTTLKNVFGDIVGRK